MSGRSLLPLLLLVAACSTEVAHPGSEAASTRRLSQPIVNGVPSTATDDSVVLITITEASGGSTCSGTLIAPNLVITARHCVSTVGGNDCGTFTTQNVPSSMTVSVGVTPGAQLATAKTIFVDTAKSNSGCSNDIALFQLDRDVPNAKISRVRFSTLTVGETARTTGYGEDGSGKLTSGRFVKTGIKVDSVGPASYTYRTAAGTTIPVAVEPGEIITGESTCFGDSGGPLFDSAGNVIGVTSRGIDGECKDRPSIFSDTASHAKFITDAAVTAGHPLTDAVPRAPDTTTPPGNPSTPSTDPTTDDGSDPEATTTTTTKSTFVPQANAGCSTAPGTAPGSTSIALAGLAGLAVLARRRRSRRSLTS